MPELGKKPKTKERWDWSILDEAASSAAKNKQKKQGGSAKGGASTNHRSADIPAARKGGNRSGAAEFDWSSFPKNEDEEERYLREREDRIRRNHDPERALQEYRIKEMNRAYEQAQQQLDANARTSKRSQIMLQGYHKDPVQQAASEAEMARNQYERDAESLRRLGMNAGSESLYADYLDRAAAAGEHVQEKVDQYNETAKKDNPGNYYAQTMSQKELEEKLRQLERAQQQTARAADQATRMASNDPDRAKVYSSEAGDGKAPYYARLMEQAQAEDQRLADEIDIYQAALAQRRLMDNTAKYQEYVAAFTQDGQLTPEAQALAARGRTAYVNDNIDASIRARSSGEENDQYYAKTYEERGVDDGYLSEAQKELYYALYARDPEIAREYLTLAQEQAENAHYQGISDLAGKNFLTQWYGMQGAAIGNLLSGLDPYGDFGQALSKTSEAITRGGAKAWNEFSGVVDEKFPVLGGKGLGDLYGLGVSMIESGIVAAASSAVGDYSAAAGKVAEFLGTTLMGSAAAASDYRECMEAGLTKQQARVHATAAGIAEAAFEYISLDKLINQASKLGADAAWKDYIKEAIQNVFVQGGVEASEEFSTTVANRISDGILAQAGGYDTKLQRRERELVAMGMDRTAARKQAEQEWLTDLINDGIGGFLSGGIMSGSASFTELSDVRQEIKARDALRQLGDTDGDLLAPGEGGRQGAVPTADGGRSVSAPAETGERRREARATAQEAPRNDNEWNVGRPMTEERPVTAPAENGRQGAGDEGRAAYQETFMQFAEQARTLDDETLQAMAENVEQNLEEVRDAAEPAELARMEAQRDALRREISRREAVERNGERIERAAQAAEVPGPVWNDGSREYQATGNRQQATEDVGREGRPMTAPTGTEERIATAPAAPRNGNIEGGLNYGEYQQGGRQGAVLTERAEQGPADGGQRDAGLGADRQAGGLGGRAEGPVSGGQGKTELAQLRNQIRALEAERRSAAQIGVNFGTKNENLRVVPEELYTSAMREEQARAEENGVRLTFVAGGAIELRGKGGRIITADGLHQVDADGAAHIFARADSRRFSPEQLTRHEDFHNIAANNRGLLLDMVEALYEEQGEEGVARMVDAYVVALDGCYGAYTEGMSEDAQRELAMLYIEEIFADQYAGMNRSSIGARQAVETAGDVAQRFAGDIENARQNRAGIERRNGPGTRFSIQDVQGQNNDYPDCVVLDTNLFDGVKPRDWGKVLQDYVYNNFADEELAIYDENWYQETVKIARYQDRVTKSGAKNSHRVIDDLARNQGNNIKNLAVAHIPELLVVSTYDKGSLDNNHQWLDQNGWTYRKAYICDKAGKIYEATLNIAEGRDRRILYDISLIKETDRRTAGGVVPSTVTGRGSPTSRSSSNRIVPNPNTPVKHFSEEQQISRINADYLRAVDNGDMRTAKRMVEEAAKRAGYDMELYHGSKKGGGFTVFKDWQYFTGNKAYAERYMERDNPDSLYHVYVKSERMFDTRRPECREIFEQMREEYGMSELQENGLPDWTDGYDISDFIEENGLDFDGVVLDEGGDLTEDGPVSRGVSYIIRNSEQVKSAEPVTYDDNGDPVDLSERFRTDRSGEEAWKNRDIRFSPSEDADDSWGVDWIGKETGETDSSTSLRSAQNDKTGERIATAPEAPRNDNEGNGGRPVTASTEERGRQSAVPTEQSYAAQAREKKVEIARKASVDGLKSRIKTAEERMKALKTAERMGLVTEESKRQDLQLRLKDTQETIDILKAELDRKKAARSAQKADQEAKAAARTQRKAEKLEAQKAAELRDNRPRQARKEFRQDALNLFSVPAAKRQTLGDLLNRFADKVIHQGSVTEQDRRELFTSLYEAGVETIQGDEYYKQIRDFTRGGRIFVPQELRSEFGDDWDAFRKQAWGNGIYLTNDSNDRGADAWNVELAEMFPGSFDAGETDGRRILEGIVELAQEGKAEHVSIEEMMLRNQRETGVSVDEQMDELERKIDQLIDTFAQKAELEVKLRKAGTMQLVKERQKNREIAARQVQKKRENDTRSQVMKQLQQLNKMRKKSAPEIQRQIDEIIGNLDVMARSISPEGLENLQELARKYAEAKDDPNFLGNPYVEQRLARLEKVQLDSLEISDVIELGRTVSALVKSVTEDKRLLTDAREREISDAAEAANKEILSSEGSKGGKLRNFLGTEHLSPTREIQRLGGWVRGGMMEQLSRALEDGGTRRMDYQRQATRIFDRFVADKANQEWLRKAQGKDAEWIKVTVPAGITGKDVLSGKDGPLVWKNMTFEITPMMRVGLLMHSRNKDNLRHIKTGGIVIPNKAEYIKGNLAEADAKGTRVKLQPEIVQAIVKDCSAQERAFAALLEQYYDGFSKDRINEVSMQIDGFERAGGDHYYGIKVSRKFLAAQPEQIQKNMSLESIGSIVNERVHAGNPIILEDASTALTGHIDLISKYYGYTAAIRDFNAVMNYTFHQKATNEGGQEYTANAFAGSVKETLGEKWGAGAQKYLDDLLADLQQSSSINETAAAFLAKLRGNLAGASLMFNPAVALSQTASLPGAVQVLGVDGVLAGLKPEKVDMGLVEKYSPILWYRNKGNSTQELGDYMAKQGLEGKLPLFFNWIQMMDSWTIRRLWAGAEYRVSKDTDLSPGSKAEIDAGEDAYYQEVARVFQRAVYDTQPNYSEMQRPAILRTDKDIVKFLTMYKTVPLQYYNMMYEAVGRLRADAARAKADPNSKQAQAELGKSKALLAKTFGGILGANVAYVIIKAAVKGLLGGKDDRFKDEDGKFDWGKTLSGLGKDLIETYAGSVICGSELLGFIEKQIEGGNYYNRGVFEISALSAVNQTIARFQDLRNKIVDQDLTGGLGAIKELAKQLAMDIGIPANNIETYLLGTAKWFAPEWVDRYENVFDEFERADLKGEHGRDLRAAIRVLMDNRTDGLKDETIDELMRLWENGQNAVIPSAIPSKVTVDGEDVEIKGADKGAFRERWGQVIDGSLEKLLASDAYQAADDAGKAKLISKLYEYARQQAAAAVTDKGLDNWVTFGQACEAAGIPLEQYLAVASVDKSKLKDMDGEALDNAIRNRMEFRVGELDEQTLDELGRLYAGGGVNVIPADIPDKVSVSGEENKLTAEERVAWLQAWKRTAGENLEALMASKAYAKADDAGKAKLISALYNMARATASSEVVAGYEPDKWITVGMVAEERGIPIDQYVAFHVGFEDLKSAEKLNLIKSQKWTESQKEFLWKKLMANDTQLAKYENIKKAGMRWADAMEQLKIGESATSSSGLTDAQQVQYDKYWTEISQPATQRLMNNAAYKSADKATQVAYLTRLNEYAAQVAKAKIIDGYDKGKWVECGERLTAAGVKLDEYVVYYAGGSDANKDAKYEALVKTGWTDSQKLIALEYISSSIYNAAKVCNSYQIDLNLYLEGLYKANTNHNSNISQDEAEDYIDSLSIGREEKAYLWQMLSIQSKWKNNPYSAGYGEEIWRDLHPDR